MISVRLNQGHHTTCPWLHGDRQASCTVNRGGASQDEVLCRTGRKLGTTIMTERRRLTLVAMTTSSSEFVDSQGEWTWMPPSTREAGSKSRMDSLHEFVVVIARSKKINGGMMHPAKSGPKMETEVRRIWRCPGERNQEAQAQVSSACPFNRLTGCSQRLHSQWLSAQTSSKQSSL